MKIAPEGRSSAKAAVTRVLAAGVAMLCVAAFGTGVAIAKDGDGRVEVRAAGSCSGRATSELKLKSRDRGIELEFEVDQNRAGTVWRIAIVHERRVAWRGVARTSAPSGSFTVERRLADLPGPDAVTARAWGAGGVTCRATVTLRGT